jgi:hypothetical protein
MHLYCRNERRAPGACNLKKRMISELGNAALAVWHGGSQVNPLPSRTRCSFERGKHMRAGYRLSQRLPAVDLFLSETATTVENLIDERSPPGQLSDHQSGMGKAPNVQMS